MRRQEAKGVAHVTLKVSEMSVLPSQELLVVAIEKAKKSLRKDIAERHGVVDTIDTSRLVNGDVEVRACFTVKRASG